MSSSGMLTISFYLWLQGKIQKVIAEFNWYIVSCSRPSEDGTIPLNIIAEGTKLSVENVEYLLMKSLSVSPCISEISMNCKMFKIHFEHLLLISFIFFISGHCHIVLIKHNKSVRVCLVVFLLKVFLVKYFLFLMKITYEVFL